MPAAEIPAKSATHSAVFAAFAATIFLPVLYPMVFSYFALRRYAGNIVYGNASGQKKFDFRRGKGVYYIKKGVGALELRRIEGEHGIPQDLAAVNPKYGTGDSYNFNCGNCIAAYELRRRGLDVEAQPRAWMFPDDWANMFEGFLRQTPISRTKAKVAEELERKILSWGEGARGTVFGIASDGLNVGHFFSAEVSGGRVMFVDSQINMANARIYFDALEPSSIVYGRLDNLKPNANIINAVKERGA